MLAMFVHDRPLPPWQSPSTAVWTSTWRKTSTQTLLPKVQTELDAFAGKSAEELCQSLSADPELLCRVVEQAYDALVSSKADQVLGTIHVSEIVEQKINEMEVEEMERLVLSVIKQELRTIINLGALIGFVIGSINVFIG